MTPKQITITKRTPPRCQVCSSLDTEFLVSYFDRSRYVQRRIGGIPQPPMPMDSAFACSAHVSEVTVAMLKKNGLVSEDAS